MSEAKHTKGFTVTWKAGALTLPNGTIPDGEYVAMPAPIYPALLAACAAFVESCPCRTPHVVSIKPRVVGVEPCDNCNAARSALALARGVS